MEKVLRTHTKVRFQDCDPFNHLNNSKYIDYFLNAREDQLIEHYDLDVYQVAAEEGLTWVVGTTQISYLSPAVTMEDVLIESRLMAYSPRHLQIEMQMWNKERSQLKSIMWMRFVHFNIQTQRSHKHNEYYLNLFEQVVNPIEQTSLEERVKYVVRNGK